MVRINLKFSAIAALYFIGLLVLICDSSNASNSKKAVILVHGAWTGEWIWDDIKRHISREGFKVFTPTLTGMGKRQQEISENITLSDHVQDVLRIINENQLEEVILVGHSYGGLVISEAAVRASDKISHLIYLDALVPLNGESGAQIIGLPFTTLEEAEKHMGLEWWKMSNEFLDDRFKSYHPTRTLFQIIQFEDVVDSDILLIYIWFEESTQPPLLGISEQLRISDRWQYHTLPIAHYDVLTKPEKISDLLLNILR